MRKTWRRSRADYPQGVVSIMDNNGKTADRYTVVYEPVTDQYGTEWFQILAMSDAPFHPQGVGMHSESPLRPTAGRGTDNKIIGFDDLPTDCQRAVMQDTAA